MPLGLRTMQFGLELINLTIPFYLTKILIGPTLYMVMSKKSFLMTCLNYLARQQLLEGVVATWMSKWTDRCVREYVCMF